MTTDLEQLLEMRRLLKEVVHIGQQVRAQLMQFDTPRARNERFWLQTAFCEADNALDTLDEHVLPDAEAAPIELADLCDMEEEG